MKKIIIIIAVVVAAIAGVAVVYFCNFKKTNVVNNDKAQSDEEHRYITIINDTGDIIKEAYITVGEGTVIENTVNENSDKKSYSVEIPKSYNDYTDFTVVLINHYDECYMKTKSNVPVTGRTEIKITKDDIIDDTTDVWKQFSKWLDNVK